MSINYADYPIGRVVSYFSPIERRELPAHIMGFSLSRDKEVILVVRVPIDGDYKTHYDEVLIHPSNVTLI